MFRRFVCEKKCSLPEELNTTNINHYIERIIMARFVKRLETIVTILATKKENWLTVVTSNQEACI